MKNKLEARYEEKAMQVALDWHLSEMPEGMTAVGIYGDLQNLLVKGGDCYAWEPFENEDVETLTNSIWNLKACVLDAMVTMALYVDNGMKD